MRIDGTSLARLNRNRRSNEGNAKAITSSRTAPLASFLPILTAIERDRIADVAFAASLNKTDERKAAQENGREVTQTDEDAHEAASGVGEEPVGEPTDDGVWRQR